MKQTKTVQKKEVPKNQIEKSEKLEIDKKLLISPFQNQDSLSKKYINEVTEFLQKELFLDIDIKILLCVSGGVDSIVMADILANISLNKNWELVICHYNHMLREESNSDEEFVRNFAKNLNIKFHSERKDIKKIAQQNKMSLEELARKQRYMFYERIAKKENVNFVATAHNSNDSAETFFINLFRGSGLTGLSGIPQKRPFFKNINLIRPLINMTKDEIISYAQKRKLNWVEDKTNSDNNFDRNKIRNELFPFIKEHFSKDIIKLTNRTAKIINAADRFIITRLSKNLEDIVVENKQNYIAIDIRKLNLFDDFSKFELVSLVFNKYFNIYDLIYVTVKNLLNLAYLDAGSKLEISSTIRAYKDRDLIYIIENQSNKTEINQLIDRIGKYEFDKFTLHLTKVNYKKIVLTDNPNIEYFDAEFMPEKLEIRNFKEGDKFKPLGLNGTIKISDFLINNKIPLIKKDELLLLTDKINIFWIIGMRIGENYKITDQSRNILKAEIIEKTL